jgi:hypothetical protein
VIGLTKTSETDDNSPGELWSHRRFQYPKFPTNFGIASILVFILAAYSGGMGLRELRAQTGTPNSTDTTVLRWDFSRQNDLNFDNLPDDWKRVYGRNYPRYLTLEIQPHNAEFDNELRQLDAQVLRHWRKWQPHLPILPELPPSLADALSNRFLLAKVDGGAIVASSPPFPVSKEYSYRMHAKMRADGLTGNRAWLELEYLDGEGKPLKTLSTNPISGSQDWKTVRVNANSAPAQANSAIVHFRYEPTDKPDMSGSVGLDDIVIEQLPKIYLVGDSPLGIFPDPAQPTVHCYVSGINDDKQEIHFRLLDERGNELQSIATQLSPLNEENQATQPSHLNADWDPTEFAGVAQWRLPSLSPGFYRVTADLSNRPSTDFDLDYTFVVLANLPSDYSPFGWSIPHDKAHHVPIRSLPEWLSQNRVHWLKFPVWTNPNDAQRLEQIAWLMSRLQDRSIRSVGVLSHPPQEVLDSLTAKQGDPAALLFRDPELWQPQLEPVMNRLTNGVRWWQLGEDDDFSFLGRAQLQQTIQEIRNGLTGYGRPIQLAINWPWVEPLPDAATWSWQTVNLNDPTPQTVDELNAYFDSTAAPNGIPGSSDNNAQRLVNSVPAIDTPTPTDSASNQDIVKSIQPWLVINPAPRYRYPLGERIRDLILRMVAVRSNGVQVAFVSNPFATDLAMLSHDGTPEEMLLPWRTTSALLGSLKPVGSLTLQGGSHNVLLVNERRALLVIWSDKPTQETLLLGPNAKQFDAFGRLLKIENVEHRGLALQQIQVTSEPTFVDDIDRIASLINLSLQLDRDRIDSIIGREQVLKITFENPTPQTLSGSLRVDAPQTWTIDRFGRTFNADAQRRKTIEIPFVLKLDATIGPAQLEFDLEVEGDISRKFIVYRQLEVGPSDVDVTLTTRLLPDGRLIVRQEFLNNSPRLLNFDNSLYAPGRQRQRRTLSVPANSQVVQEFSWNNGKELVGKDLLLRCEEQSGLRTLNFRILATQ